MCGSLAQAREVLSQLGALDEVGDLTPHGSDLSSMPLPPRLGHMVLRGACSGQAGRASQIAAILTERGLGGRSLDLSTRISAFNADRSPRARAAARLANRWAASAGPTQGNAPLSDGRLLALAFPERIAKARGEAGAFLLANGRGAFVDPADALASQAWLVVAELGGGTARDRILLAASLDANSIKADFASSLSRTSQLEWSASGTPKAVQRLCLGSIVIEESQVRHPDTGLVVDALIAQVRAQGLDSLPWGDQAGSLRARATFAGVEALNEITLMASLETWLSPVLTRRPVPLARLSDGDLTDALMGLLSWDEAERLRTLAPKTWTAPTGSSLAINYNADGGPLISMRVQELFGLTLHPTIGHGHPLTLALLSPAHRPIQLTRDLPGFWAGSWSEVRKDMRGRYPKHPWPEDPANAPPTRKAKPRG